MEPSYRVAGWLFFRLLGLAYLLAFWSLGLQIVGLIGHDGILPAASYLARAREVLGGVSRVHLLPTLAWVSASDAFLRGLCVAGSLLALLLTLGIGPALVLPVLWLLYLSLTVVCGDFLAYQWDALLLETGLLAAWAAPWTLRDRLDRARDLPAIGRALLLWLLFRLMVGSGAVKLASGDPTWRRLTALAYHFWTQPLPTPGAWYASLLPGWMLRSATAATLGIELVLPFAVLPLVPTRLRRWSCGLLIGLQAAIAVTGNYAFFNVLAIALCVLMLDDTLLMRFVPERRRPDAFRPPVERAHLAGTPRWALVVLAAVVVPVSATRFAGSLGVDAGVPIVDDLAVALAPFRSVNAYGLFAVMTTHRPEIVVEGSDDRLAWRPYEFEYKPGDVDRRPPWVAPHQPRLDWQMWFAALERYEENPWFQAFCRRLLEGAPDVVALVARDPFPGRPPKYVRGVLFEYRFSTPEERRRTGAWWSRARVGNYSPVLSLDPNAP